MNSPSQLSANLTENLEELVRVNIDSAKGFSEASDLIDDPELRGQFQGAADHRRSQAEELQRHVTRQDPDWEARGTFSAKVHRVWMDLKDRFSGTDNLVGVLEEVERGEDHIKQKYEEVLGDEPGSELEPLLRRQYEAVKAVHDKMRDFRDRLKQG